MKTLNISVVIPVKNEADLIPDCLESLLQQTMLPAEVIVVDNGSTDASFVIACSYIKKFKEKNIPFYILQEMTPGTDNARQKGCLRAKSPIIAMTDADSRLTSTWIERISAHFSSTSDIAVTGRLTLFDVPTLILWIDKVHLFEFWEKMKNHVFGFTSLLGSNCAVRSSALQKVGGFHNTLSFGMNLEDFELAHRLSQFGTIGFDPSIMVHTSARAYATIPLALGTTIKRWKAIFHILKARKCWTYFK